MHSPGIMQFFVLCAIAICGIASGKLPSYMTKCKKSDPQLSNCIIEASEQTRSHLEKGIPELGLPSAQPLSLPAMGSYDVIGLSLDLTDIQVYDVLHFKIKDFKLDLEKNSLYIKVEFPNLSIKYKYAVKGQLGPVFIDSTGPCSVNVTNTVAEITGTGTRKTIGGKEHLDIESNLQKVITYDTVKFYDYDLYPNDKELSMQVHELLRENMDDIIKDEKPIFHEFISKLLSIFVIKVLTHLPLEELFD